MKTKSNDNKDFQIVMAFLEENNKNAILELRKENPEYEQIFSSGELLSVDDEKGVEKKLIALKKAQLKGIEKALPELIKRTIEKIEKLRNTLKKLRRYQFISKLITLISGSVILTTLIILSSYASGVASNELIDNVVSTQGNKLAVNYLDFIAPSLVLLSSILTLFYDYKIEDYLGGNKQEKLKKLIANNAQAKTLLLYDIKPLKKHFVYQLSDNVIKRAAEITSELEKTA